MIGSVGELHLCLGVIHKKMRLVTRLAPETEVVYPNLKSFGFTGLKYIRHSLGVTLHIRMREHMYDDVHISHRHFMHIRNNVRDHSVAVVCGTCSKSFHHSLRFISLILFFEFNSFLVAKEKLPKLGKRSFHKKISAIVARLTA